MLIASTNANVAELKRYFNIFASYAVMSRLNVLKCRLDACTLLDGIHTILKGDEKIHSKILRGISKRLRVLD